MHLAIMAAASLQPVPAQTHRMTIMTPSSGQTCSFVTEHTGPVGRRASLWQNDVIHRKIASRDENVDPGDWADGIERLHGPAAFRLKAVGPCRATDVVVYADSAPAADLDLIDALSKVRPTGCVGEDMREANRRHNAALRLPKGITVVFALFKKETDGFYESVLTHYWDREVPNHLEEAGRPCPPPVPHYPPAPVPPPVR